MGCDGDMRGGAGGWTGRGEREKGEGGMSGVRGAKAV